MNEITLPNGKKITMNVVSSRRFEIKTDHPEVIINRKGTEFVNIQFSEYLTLKKGLCIDLEDSKRKCIISYILNDIENSKGLFGIEQKINKTCIFILPLLCKQTFSFFEYDYSLYNGFISEDYNYLYLQYKFNNSEEYLKLEDKLSSLPEFIQLYDPSEQFVIFKFKLNNKYTNDIINLVEGKYSQISENSKKEILAFHKLNNTSFLGQVLYKNKELKTNLEKSLNMQISKDSELMSKFELEEELWNYQSISQKIGIQN